MRYHCSDAITPTCKCNRSAAIGRPKPPINTKATSHSAYSSAKTVVNVALEHSLRYTTTVYNIRFTNTYDMTRINGNLGCDSIFMLWLPSVAGHRWFPLVFSTAVVLGSSFLFYRRGPGDTGPNLLTGAVAIGAGAFRKNHGGVSR